MTLTEQRERKIEELDYRINELRKKERRLREAVLAIDDSRDTICIEIDELCKDRDYLINKKRSQYEVFIIQGNPSEYVARPNNQKRKGIIMQSQKQFYVLSRDSIHDKPEEWEFQTEEEALTEAIRLLKRGDLVEFGEEIAIGFQNRFQAYSSSELGDRFSIIKGENMKDRQKALEAWKEDHFGSSEGFEDDWEAESKDDRLKVWEDRFFNDEADLY